MKHDIDLIYESYTSAFNPGYPEKKDKQFKRKSYTPIKIPGYIRIKHGPYADKVVTDSLYAFKVAKELHRGINVIFDGDAIRGFMEAQMLMDTTERSPFIVSQPSDSLNDKSSFKEILNTKWSQIKEELYIRRSYAYDNRGNFTLYEKLSPKERKFRQGGDVTQFDITPYDVLYIRITQGAVYVYLKHPITIEREHIYKNPGVLASEEKTKESRLLASRDRTIDLFVNKLKMYEIEKERGRLNGQIVPELDRPDVPAGLKDAVYKKLNLLQNDNQTKPMEYYRRHFQKFMDKKRELESQGKRISYEFIRKKIPTHIWNQLLNEENI